MVMIQVSDEQLHAAAGNVLDGLLGGALDELGDHEGPERPWCSTVGITGEFDGLVVVRCAEATARELAAGMFDEDPDSLPATDVADALGEVANQVGGVVKSMVPGPSSLGLPVVATGSGLARTELPFLSSASLDRDEGRVDVFVFGRPR